MSSRQLSEPITDSGIQNVNFFNGRLLTADDLSAVTDSGREHDRQLAKGIGEGVVHGLEVELANSSTPAQPVVRVSGGLALCRSGNPVALSVPTVDVALVKAAQTFAAEAGLFVECPGPGTADNLSKLGIYVFVATPASAYEGSVPMRHSVSNDRVDGCGRRFAVEGVKFRMERIDFSTLPGVSDATRALLNTLTTKTDAPSVSLLRNVVAHLCFDSEEKTGARRDPFKRPASGTDFVNYGALAELRAAGQLSDCDVPLAIIYWSQQGVRFVDNWAARRLARRQLDLDVESLLRGYGYERLLQFQRHLRDLFDTLGGLASVRLQDHFRFVPPAGFYQVAGVRSPRGFHSTTFFRQYTIGAAGTMTAERFGALLRESFAAPDVDLAAKPVFQIYRVRENVRAVAESASPSQLYQVFVTRALNGPLGADGVARTFYDAWEAYRGLVKRRTFLPPGTDAEKIAAQLSITGAIRDVLDFSNRHYALGAAGALDTDGALGSLGEMHRIQNELATLFQSDIPGVPDTQDRASFGRTLAGLLNTTLPAGKPALGPAVGALDLPAAVEAQDTINRFVAGWTGQGVALGPFGATWHASTEGQKLVRGRPEPFPHQFVVNNGTDKRLTIELRATLEGSGGDWKGEAWVENMQGQQIESVDLARGTNVPVVIQTKAPESAPLGDVATLTLRTIVGPPTSRTNQSTLSLEVSEESGGAVTSRVVFDEAVAMPTPDPDNVGTNQPLTYGFNLNYHAAPGNTGAGRFRLVVNLTTDPAANDPINNGWRVRLENEVPTMVSAGVFAREFDLPPGAALQQRVTIFAPRERITGQDQTAAFTVGVESVSLTPQISSEYPNDSSPATFRLRLRAG